MESGFWMTCLNNPSQQHLYDVFTISHVVYLTIKTANYCSCHDSKIHCYKKTKYVASKNQPSLPKFISRGSESEHPNSTNLPIWILTDRTLRNLPEKTLAKPSSWDHSPRAQSRMGWLAELLKGVWDRYLGHEVGGERAQVQEHSEASRGRAAWNVKSTSVIVSNSALHALLTSPIWSLQFHPCSCSA